MIESDFNRTPSDDLAELGGQLVRELSRLDEPNPEEPELFRAYVQHAQVLAWQGVADGRMGAPREALSCLQAAQPFVDHHLPDLSPTAAAAVEVYVVTRSLYLAVEALEARTVEDRLADERSATERAILKVLAENRGAYLRRGRIYEKLTLPEKGLTPARVGQVLVELHDEGLLLRQHGRAQGNPNAAFYALSPRGVELCRNLGLVPEEEVEEEVEEESGITAAAVESQATERIYEFVNIALDPARHRYHRRIARDTLASKCFGPLKNQVLRALSVAAEQKEGDRATQELVDEALVTVAQARRVPAVESDASQPGVLVSQALAEPVLAEV